MYGLNIEADYATVEAVKRHLSSEFVEVGDDTFLAELIRAASDMFALNTQRVFVPYAATLTVVPYSGSRDLSIPDVIALTSITPEDANALDADQYRLDPANGYPKTTAFLTSSRWVSGAPVALIGTFGYHPQPAKMWKTLAIQTAEALDDSETEITLSLTTAGGLETLDYIKVGDEVMQVTAIVVGEEEDDPTPDVPTVITVERGALGTTAAAHNDAAAIAQYQQYEAVRRAVIFRAATMYRNRANPGGESVQGLQGSFVTVPREPASVAQTEYRLRRAETLTV